MGKEYFEKLLNVGKVQSGEVADTENQNVEDNRRSNSVVKEIITKLKNNKCPRK